MNVELFVLCDAATDYHGKLNVLGAFDAIWAKTMPVTHPLCAVALRIRFSKTESGEHKVRINIVDEDGKTVVPPMEANVSVQFKDKPLTSIATNMIVNLQGLKFQKYGEFAIDLAIDGKHEASLPLFVNQMPEHA